MPVGFDWGRVRTCLDNMCSRYISYMFVPSNYTSNVNIDYYNRIYHLDKLSLHSQRLQTHPPAVRYIHWDDHEVSVHDMNNYIHNVMALHIIHNSPLRHWQFIICDVSYPVEELIDFSIDPRNVRHSTAETPGSNTW